MSETLAALVTLFGITALVLAYIFQPLRKAWVDRNASSARPALQIQYERVLGILRDLETDWRTGKLPDEDYYELRRRYLEEGATLLRAIQEGGEAVDWKARVEAAVQARRAQLRRKSA
ncbi:hypothetical protein [Thermoflexus sp.]|uniref:hypothetical protein n=1 Tax=Thermoflexus sp. TaxID=1969742 RepID=UPI002ADE928F|nr:hypothetical protein [Thermoflexus sp.]